MTGPTLDDILACAAGGWEVFPLRGKLPAIPKADGGNGVLDATTDPAWLAAHWRPGFNIGARVPSGLVVIDTDPRHGGEENLLHLAAELGGLPPTLTCFSGRGDGGRHRYYRHPGGDLTGKRLPEGVDLKDHRGYVVLPPSLHPATGKPYQWSEPAVDIARCPDWLATILRVPKRPAPAKHALKGDCGRYAETAVARVLERIAAAPPGQHHWVINAESYGLGRLVGAGIVEEDEALRLLDGAAQALCTKAHTGSIRCGLAAGKAHPIRMATT